MTLHRVFLSLGSNIGDRLAALQTAINSLHRPDFKVVRISEVYETTPVDFTAQADFLNIALESQGSIFPRQLLKRIQRIEFEMGRTRQIPKGPRTIDIDILFFGSSVVHTSDLQIPHPRMTERRFVLQPLADIAGDFRHPITGRTIDEMLAAAPDQFVRRTAALLPLPGSHTEGRT